MENKNKELLLQKIDELVELIKNSSDYKRYTELKERMENSHEIMNLILKIKKEEQKIVKKEYRKEDTSIEENNLFKLKEELMSYPIYEEYSYLQEDINNNLQNIKMIMENCLNKISS